MADTTNRPNLTKAETLRKLSGASVDGGWLNLDDLVDKLPFERDAVFAMFGKESISRATPA